jgi:N-acylneuraminate cytidylyltransferase
MTKPKAVAFIPARSGSKRVPDKNILPLGGHPLLAYSIRSAIDSGIFEAVICATDSERYADIARYYGAEVPFLRSPDISGDHSPDIEWVEWMLNRLEAVGLSFDAFSILRPTSPFRLPNTIRRAWDAFCSDLSADALRAVEKTPQHPGKMWVIRESRLLPVFPFLNASTPWHSCQYAALPEIYVQDASLEIAWTRIPLKKGTICGESIIPFVSAEYEGFDINRCEDWWTAEYLISHNLACLPIIEMKPYHLKIEGKN